MAFNSHPLRYAVLVLGILLLSGCAETELVSHWVKQITWPGQQESKGTYKVGNPYKIGSVWYYPQESFSLVETGIASWYGPDFHAGRTANGEIFDQNELTAAHRTLQLPSLARVTNLENGRSVVVRVNDRGPFMRGRVMDVSMRAAELLGFANKGTARVRIEVLERESRILASAARRGEDTTRMTLADLQNKGDEVDQKTAVIKDIAPVKMASVDTDADTNNALPESLRTPTITVEELASSGTSSGTVVSSSEEPVSAQPSGITVAPPLTAGHLNRGRFMPDPIISKSPVRPTGIYVQAGSFAIYDNAERLAKKLSVIAPTVIDPVVVNARKLYRVKLGPIVSVAAADSILEKVIRVGDVGARVIK